MTQLGTATRRKHLFDTAPPDTGLWPWKQSCLSSQPAPEAWRSTMPTTTERGYGARHKAERARWAPKVAEGNVMCARQGPDCTGQPITPDQDWDLGHDDHDRTKYRGPECLPCNRGTGGRNGAAVTNAKHSMTTRDW